MTVAFKNEAKRQTGDALVAEHQLERQTGHVARRFDWGLDDRDTHRRAHRYLPVRLDTHDDRHRAAVAVAQQRTHGHRLLPDTGDATTHAQ